MRLDFFSGKYGMQLFLLLILSLIGLILSQFIGFGLLLYFTDFSLSQFTSGNYLSLFMDSPKGYLAFFILLSTQSIGLFILPSVLFHRLMPKESDSTKTSRPKIITFLAFLPLFALSGIVVVGFLGEWNMKLPLPQIFHEMESTANQTVEYLLSFRTPEYTALNIVLLCLLPAVGEELFFRGVIQKNLVLSTQKEWLGILLTAFIFSAIHFQFLTFLPRFFMGIMLGYIFVWSRNILVPILAHFFHNLFSILVVLYMANENDVTQGVNMNISLVLVSTVVLAAISYRYFMVSKNHYAS